MELLAAGIRITQRVFWARSPRRHAAEKHQDAVSMAALFGEAFLQ